MTINLNVEEHIYKLFFILKIFCFYLEVHCQDCQNNPLSMDPHSFTNGYQVGCTISYIQDILNDF
jgi:hypothetical protein